MAPGENKGHTLGFSLPFLNLPMGLPIVWGQNSRALGLCLGYGSSNCASVGESLPLPLKTRLHGSVGFSDFV